MVYDLYNELATSATGTDCPATAAWLAAYLGDTGACQRAALHWQAASDALREALASQMGMCEPTGERCPVPPAIWRDYEYTLATAMDALAS